MPDYWELQYGLSPTNSADSALDLDGDGMSNAAEYFAGTDPTQPGSVLKLNRIAKTPTGYDVIQWSSIGGKQYRVQYQDSSSYSPSNFLDLIRPSETDPAPTGAPSISSFTNDFSLSPSNQRYYRIKLLP